MNDIEFLKTFGDLGFNSHENNSNDFDYFNDFLNNYLPLKRTILNKLKNTNNPDLITYLNALRIYSYSIYENLWHGYVISYSDFDTIKFRLNGKSFSLAQNNLFKNHLPSFSSAIMNYGTCRDYYFVLLRISVNPNFSKSNIKDTLKIGYTTFDKSEYIPDLNKLTTNKEYIKSAILFLNNNSFRNFYAHRLRLIWWKNQNTQDYFFKKGLIDSINGIGKEKWTNHLGDIFFDVKKYELEIQNANSEDVVSSTEILKKNHDDIASFMNNTFKFVMDKVESEIK